jgi:antitoxin component of MazEF toxin-antitoxin module
MVKRLKLSRAGQSVRARLPKAMVDHLHLAAGDRVLAIETDHGILLVPRDPDIEKAFETAERAAKTYRGVLRSLAK